MVCQVVGTAEAPLQTESVPKWRLALPDDCGVTIPTGAMMRFKRCICMFTAFVVVCLGCGGGEEPSGIITPPPAPTQMTLTASATDIAPGGWIQFTVNALNSETVLKLVSIDFDGNGTWDEVKSVDQSSITEEFTHTYGSAGTFTVRAEVKDANNVPTMRTLVVRVTAPPLPALWWSIGGDSSVNTGSCYAYGPPVTAPGGLELLTTEKTGPLASQPSGSTVSVTQEFMQERYLPGGPYFYHCTFHVFIYADTPAGAVRIGEATCQSQSDPNEARFCTATASGVVP